MKKWIRTFAVLAAVASLSPDSLFGQAQPQSGSPGVLLAVIDMNQAFEKHAAFQQRLKQIEADVKAFDTELQGERQRLKAQQEQLEALKPGSADYRRVEADIARKVSDIQVRAQLKKKEIINLEAKQYFEAYKDILAAVDEVAQAHGIGLVLRFDSRAIDPADRASVLRGVNRSVVFQKNLDITSLVLDALQRRHGSAARRNTPGAGNF